MLVTSDNKFHRESCQFQKTRRKTNGLNFRKFDPRCEKTANRSLLARYCDESNGRFEALRNLVYVTLVESRGDIAD